MQSFVVRWWPFTLLCFAAFARLVLAENFPSVLPGVASLAIACAILAAVCTTWLALHRRTANSWKDPEGARAALAGILLFCGPESVVLFRPADVSVTDALLACSLVPVVVAIASAARGNVSLSAKTLWPGIAASAALLLLVPEPHVRSFAGAATLVALPVLTGTGIVLISEASRAGVKWLPVLAPLGAAIVFAIAALLRHAPANAVTWQACAFDVVILSATLASIRHLGAARYSASFVLLPLSLLFFGLLLLRRGVNFRTALGLAILIASAVDLLRTQDADRAEISFRLLD